MVVADLLGPQEGPTEVLPGRRPVRDHYLVGMLAPAGTLALDPARTERTGVEGLAEPGEVSDGVDPAKATFFPSSVGFTFAADSSVSSLRVMASWGRYTKERSEVPESGTGPTVWCRNPAGGSIEVALAEGDLAARPVSAEQPEVVVRGRANRLSGVWLVSLFLVNGQCAPRINKDEAWLFQASLAVESAGDHRAIFVGRAEALPDAARHASEEAETALLDLQYRDTVEFAVGHATAVHATVAPGDPSRAERLETTALPGFELAVTEAPGANDVELSFPVREALGRVTLDMEVLASTAEEQWAEVLNPLAEAYEVWLDEQERRLDGGDERLMAHAQAARTALGQARHTAARLRAGIAVVASDPDAAEALRFANHAMWQQRVHALAGARRHSPGGADESLAEALARFAHPRYHSWRPFQLAFLVLNLAALVDPTHPERAEEPGLVDLLFFPTGGGKTEAYLGLTAFVLAIRRLQGIVDCGDGSVVDGRSGGVAVLMRYTLRLLTAQQFQRAAALICACEVARRAKVGSDARWGETPFRLGMWVGSGVTPNREAEAAERIESDRMGRYRGGRSSPLQLMACPWCGTRLDAAQHVVPDPHRWRTLVYCGDPFGECPFSAVRSPGEGIPVVTVDESIYRLLPALVIATVDKFAQLPWQGPLHLLFGRVATRCPRHGYRSGELDQVGDHQERDSHPARGGLPAVVTEAVAPLRPPDLIIQDELHLISGPLGTMVGLFETAVDALSTWELGGVRVRPKVVASTATVRRAAEQAHAVFWRDLAIFPPPVLDAGDSFFAQQRPVSPQRPGRRYLGICAHGHRLKSVEVRVFTTLLAAGQRLHDRYGLSADPWMTMVGYFNALRELGGAKRLLDDDVRARLRTADRRGLARRRRLITEELTSRVASTEIPAVLDRLGVVHDPGREEGSEWPIDVLLATSMISVGVDVARLGLMVAVGQPKTTSEYIQATSRVGRDEAGPGLVVTIYNWIRPRDLSHFESFEHYHASLYRHIEALSVTPFSARALDRGLAALLVALVRHATRAEWNPNLGAGAVEVSSAELDRVVEIIASRAAGVSSEVDTEDLVRDMLARRLDLWDAQEYSVGVQLGYREDQRAAVRGLLRPAGMAAWSEFSCPNSLRETEPAVNLIVEAERIDHSLAGAPAFVLGAGTPSVPSEAETAEDGDVEGADGVDDVGSEVVDLEAGQPAAVATGVRP